MRLLRAGDAPGRVTVILPVHIVKEIVNHIRNLWREAPQQQDAVEILVTSGLTRGRAKRTLTSRWCTMMKDMFGGLLWFQVIVATGTIPERMLKLANAILASQAWERPAASSQGPPPRDHHRPGGSQHKVSPQKKLPPRGQQETKKHRKRI